MLSEKNKIDLITQEPETGLYRLIMCIAQEEWSLEYAHYFLREKLNAYAIFALDGGLARLSKVLRPQATIVIAAETLPPEETRRFLSAIRDALRKESLDVVLEVRTEGDASEAVPF